MTAEGATVTVTAAAANPGAARAERFAIQLMVAQAVLFSAETVAIHHLGHRLGSGVSPMQLALVRGLGGLLLAVALARHLGLAVLRTRQLALQLLRGGVSLLYLWVMIYSFGRLPFADATAISFTQAAYIVAFSVLILGEAASWPRWVGAALGIAGALLIAKPAFADWHGAYLVALLGAGLNGLAFVLSRYLQRQDSEATTLLYTNLVAVLGSAPVLTTVGLPPLQVFSWLPCLLLFGPVGMYLGIVAVKHAPAAMLAPYTLLRLLIALIGGAVVFREAPDALSTAGALLILASCALSRAVVPRFAGFLWPSGRIARRLGSGSRPRAADAKIRAS